MQIDNSPQGSPGWFEARLGVPTASQFKDVVAVSKAKKTLGEPLKARSEYAYKLVAERLGGAQAQFVSAAMQRGIDQEPVAVELYEARMGEAVERVGFALADSGLYGASPDGLVGSDGMLEVKTRAPHLYVADLHADDPDDIPPEYRVQLVGQLLVSGREWCDLAQYCESLGQLRIVRLYPTADELAALEAELVQFCAELDQLEALTLELMQPYAIGAELYEGAV